jgi:hypothetical protein
MVGKRCPNCYSINSSRNIFCASCGARLEQPDDAVLTAKPASGGMAKKLWLILILEVAIAAMIITALLVGALTPNSPQSSGEALVTTSPSAATTTSSSGSLTTKAALPIPEFSNNPTPTDVPGFIVLPTVTPLPTYTPVPVVTILAPTPAGNDLPPSPTNPPQPTATTNAPAAPVSTPQPASSSFNPYQLEGSYKRDDGTLYGRPQVTLYGAGSGYNQGTTSFNVEVLSNRQIFLKITGLDDERGVPNQFQVLINGTTIFDGPSGFPHVPNGDIGIGGSARYWGQMSIAIPAGTLKKGTNTLTIRNASPNGSVGSPPYILISNLEFSTEE